MLKWKISLNFFKKDEVLVRNKKELRKKILMLLKTQKEGEQLTKSLIIRDKLFNLPEYQEALTILFYASFQGEVNTFNMINESQSKGKKIALPKIDRGKKIFVPILVEYSEKELIAGSYGIMEPKKTEGMKVPLENIDMVIVPGIAFDKKNNRLGRGEGYYDKFLKKLPPTLPTIGLAYDFQIVENFPFQESHDVPVSQVLIN